MDQIKAPSILSALRPLLFLIVYLDFPCPAHSSFNFTVQDMRRAAINIIDSSKISISEFGMRINDEVGTLFIGRPGSPKYETWVERIQHFSPKHTFLNSLSQKTHDIDCVKNIFFVSRDSRYLCQNEEDAKEFIKSEIEELINNIKGLLTANCSKIFICGKIYIYGIEDQSQYASLLAFIKNTERDKFNEAFGCIFNFI